MGIPLDRIVEIRKLYDRDPAGIDSIDFLEDDYTLPRSLPSSFKYFIFVLSKPKVNSESN